MGFVEKIFFKFVLFLGGWVCVIVILRYNSFPVMLVTHRRCAPAVRCSSMRSRFLSRFSIGVFLSGAAVLLQGCTDSCMDDGFVTVCCPSVFCKNDEGCCLKDPLNLCSGENGTGRLLEFVRNKQASGFSCLEERASEAMIENGKIKVSTTTVTTMTMTVTRWP